MPSSMRRAWFGPAWMRPSGFPRARLSVTIPSPRVLSRQHHRIVDDTAVLVADQCVLALADRALAHVARREQVHEGKSLRPVDFHGPLHPNVPQRRAVANRPVFLVFGLALEINRMEDVVVPEERGGPQPPEDREQRRLQITHGMNKAIVIEVACGHLRLSPRSMSGPAFDSSVS